MSEAKETKNELSLEACCADEPWNDSHPSPCQKSCLFPIVRYALLMSGMLLITIALGILNDFRVNLPADSPAYRIEPMCSSSGCSASTNLNLTRTLLSLCQPNNTIYGSCSFASARNALPSNVNNKFVFAAVFVALYLTAMTLIALCFTCPSKNQEANSSCGCRTSAKKIATRCYSAPMRRNDRATVCCPQWSTTLHLGLALFFVAIPLVLWYQNTGSEEAYAQTALQLCFPDNHDVVPWSLNGCVVPISAATPISGSFEFAWQVQQCCSNVAFVYQSLESSQLQIPWQVANAQLRFHVNSLLTMLVVLAWIYVGVAMLAFFSCSSCYKKCTHSPGRQAQRLESVTLVDSV